jgi:hypothetical protein
VRRHGREPDKDKADGRAEWVDPNTIRPGPIRRDSLTDERVARIRASQATFADVDGQTVGQRVDDFERGADPDGELRVWERMAKAYRVYREGRNLSHAAKTDVYRVVLLRSTAPEQKVLERVKTNEPIKGKDRYK